MFLRALPVLYLAAFGLIGCARRHPLLVPSQAKLIRKEDKYLSPYAKPIQDKITIAGTSGALVISQREKTTSPIILPANDPLSAAAGNLDAVASGADCIFLLRSDFAIPPEQLTCASLVLRVKEALAIQARDDQQDATLSALRGDLEALKKQLTALGESVKQDEAMLQLHAATLNDHEKALRNQQALLAGVRTDVEKLAAVLAPTTNLVSFHDKQLAQIESMLDSVGKRYQKTADVVGQNNKQIETMITDLNNSFSRVRQTLEQMQQKLDTIK